MPATPHDASVPGSTIIWRLTGTVNTSEINVTFTVPNAYTWQRETQSIKLDNPCSNTSTLIVRTDGSLGKVSGRPTIWLKGTQATNALADLETVWAKIGPWTLATPEGSFSVTADPTQGPFTKTNQDAHIEVQMGFRAV